NAPIPEPAMKRINAARSSVLVARRRMRLCLELLEERLAPAAGELLYQATGSMALLLRASGSNIQVVYADSPSTVLASRSLFEITDGIHIVGNGFNVGLTIDVGVPQVRGGIFFDAGSGTNTLTGPGVDSTWHVTGPGAGYLGSPDFLRFAGVENLTG